MEACHDSVQQSYYAIPEVQCTNYLPISDNYFASAMDSSINAYQDNRQFVSATTYSHNDFIHASNKSGNYIQEPMQNNMYIPNLNITSVMQHVSIDSHTSAPHYAQVPINKMISSVVPRETSYINNFSIIERDVSPLCESAMGSPCTTLSRNMPMNEAIGCTNSNYSDTLPLLSFDCIKFNFDEVELKLREDMCKNMWNLLCVEPTITEGIPQERLKQKFILAYADVLKNKVKCIPRELLKNIIEQEKRAKSDSDMSNSSAISKAELRNTSSESVESKWIRSVGPNNVKHQKAFMLDFSHVEGVVILPAEFHAKDFNEQRQIASMAKLCSACMESKNSGFSREKMLIDIDGIGTESAISKPSACVQEIRQIISTTSNDDNNSSEDVPIKCTQVCSAEEQCHQTRNEICSNAGGHGGKNYGAERVITAEQHSSDSSFRSADIKVIVTAESSSSLLGQENNIISHPEIFNEAEHVENNSASSSFDVDIRKLNSSGTGESKADPDIGQYFGKHSAMAGYEDCLDASLGKVKIAATDAPKIRKQPFPNDACNQSIDTNKDKREVSIVEAMAAGNIISSAEDFKVAEPCRISREEIEEVRVVDNINTPNAIGCQASLVEDRKENTSVNVVPIEVADELQEAGGHTVAKLAMPNISDAKPNMLTSSAAKGRDKHKGRKPKITVSELLVKYKKEIARTNTHRPNTTKQARQQQKCEFQNQDWQKGKYNVATPYSYSRPPMPSSWIHPHAGYHQYSSWDWYVLNAYYPSYVRPYHETYVAPENSVSSKKSYCNGRFDESNRSGAINSKRIVKQVYRVKKDGRKGKHLDLNTDKQRSINVLEKSASSIIEVEQDVDKNINDKFRKREPKGHNKQGIVLLSEKQKQPIRPIGLSIWQEKKLEELSADELKARGMAWVPKLSVLSHHKSDDRKRDVREKRSNLSSKRSTSDHQNYWSLSHPYFSPMSFRQGMFDYPSLTYFNSWPYAYLYHECMELNYYAYK